MPHRPKKVKKDKSAAKGALKGPQADAQRRQEMATRSILSRYQNRTSERK